MVTSVPEVVDMTCVGSMPVKVTVEYFEYVVAVPALAVKIACSPGTLVIPPKTEDSSNVPTRLKHPLVHPLEVSVPPISIFTILLLSPSRDPTVQYM
jgi:hypothetical protein|tara:strand:+ start:11878 stop:12168 length:291 start_codon:yes stop_codon:yes gene_type:complete